MKKTLSILSTVVLLSCSDNDKTSGTSEEAHGLEGAKGAVATAVAEAAAENEFHKYDIRSGIVTYDELKKIGNTEIKTRRVIYFDDWGMKESEEEYKNVNGEEVLMRRDFVKDGHRYTCSVENNGGSKTKAMGYGVALRFDLQEGSNGSNHEVKKIGEETIAGKNCNGFSMETPSGLLKVHGWNKITLKTVVENSKLKMSSQSVATKIEEGVDIPGEKFEVPKGVQITEM